MFSKSMSVCALAIGSLLPASTTALAHAQLQQAVPAVGGTVRQAPTRLMLTFSEGIEPRFSSVTLASSTGAPIALGRLSVGPPTVVKVAVQTPLKPGTYTVKWRATSVDSHKTQGSYRFTVAP